MKFYTGVGSRETPPDVLEVMTKIARRLCKQGYTLRSGAAQGADQAFETGSNNSEIYLPWSGFEGNKSTLTYSKDAMTMAAKFHPAWSTLSDGAKSLMARNCHQVLGQDLKTPSDFLICWTKGGRMFGGTAQALRIANRYDIKVYNLGKDTEFKFWLNLVSELQMNLF